MIHLRVLSGKKAGTQLNASRYPVRIGRAPEADLVLDDPGTWPRHCRISPEPEGLVCQAEANALLAVNGVPTDHAVLRNGDIISIGAMQIEFTLAPVRQASLLWREWLVWSALAFLCLAQIATIYHLLR